MTKRDISCDTRLLPCDTSLSLFFTHAAHFTEALILVTDAKPEAGTGSDVQTPFLTGGMKNGLFCNSQARGDRLTGNGDGNV